MDVKKVYHHLKSLYDFQDYKTPSPNTYQSYCAEKNHSEIFKYILFLAQQDLINSRYIHFRIKPYIKDWYSMMK